ncbi:metallophosphoesterase [Metabacillus halosaccharovorans]|uniref:metallophosphoesterase n=1 Tax=Metabacillus halosaccharovorans TaxID=930124 RepID=UPI0020401B1F|nr:metallophosphoesterase [Metabacillus halosaccharovorans]MCM3443084.1 metallophosphoesterase [Metabacillus halosaccharovorans]
MKRIVAIILCLLVVLNPFVNAAYAISSATQQDNTEEQMPVFFTEVYPDDKSNSHMDGAGSNDLFEFVEIYNDTDSELDFNSLYKVRYDYVSNKKDLAVTSVDDKTNLEVMIPAKSPAVLWVERTTSNITGAAANVTEEDFRKYHKIPAEVPVFKLRGQDGLNNVDRGFYITKKDENDDIISHVHYTSEDVGDGLSYHVKVPKNGPTMDSFVKEAAPTAGVVNEEQLIPTLNHAPVITHSKVESVEAGSDFKVTATAEDADQDPLTVKLFYRIDQNEAYHEVDMELGEGTYFYTIPGEEISGTSVVYYMTVSDGTENVQSETLDVAIVSSTPKEEPEEENEAPVENSDSTILFTEIYPNDKDNSQINGAGSNDLFEFVEIYNLGDEELDFNSIYKIRYDWRTGTKDLSVTAADDASNESVKIPANSPAVLWIERTHSSITDDAANLKEADFRSYHNISDDVPVFKVRNQDGLPNSSDRSFYITTKDDNDNIISEIRYTGDDVADGKSFHTRIPQEGVTAAAYLRKGNPTPGVVDAEQLVASSNVKPIITHHSEGTIEKGSDFTVDFLVDDADGDPVDVKFFYRLNPYGEFNEISMEPVQNSQYSYTIPADSISGDVIHYYIEANDGEANVQTEIYEMMVNGKGNGEVPKILITEMTPNPAGDYRKGSGNQYEYMEVFNNSDEVLNLKGYTLFYLYPNNSAAPKKRTITEETSIDPYSTGIIWFAKEAVRDGYTTVEDFNIHYNSAVEEKEIVIYDNKNSSDFNLPNSLQRGLAISSSDSLDDMIVEAWYDPSSTDSPDRMINDLRNSSVIYKYPESGKSMERIEARAYSNPGSIDEGQVPEVSGLDVVAPMIKHDQPFYQMQTGVNKKITMTSHEELANAELVYGTAENPLTDFTNHVEMNVVKQVDGKYVYEAILNIDDLGRYRYMIIAEDVSGNVTKVPYNSRGNQITVIEGATGRELPEVGLSLSNGEMVSGNVGFYAYGESANDDMVISFDGQELEAKSALPGKATLGFQANGIDYIYQASASAKNPAGEREYFTRISPSYVSGAWYTYDMSPDYFISDSIVSIHSGGENVPYDLDVHDEHFNKTNFDDFEVINVHLVLPDGTTIKPENVRSYLGNLQQTVLPYRENVFYALGDGSAPTNTNLNKPMKSDFIFTIPKEKLTAKYSEIDTTAFADGTYELNLNRNNATADTAEVTIDNTDPVIDGISYSAGSMIKDSEKLKGDLFLDVKASDNLTGISKVEATLDGEAVSFPYETSSKDLASGDHELDVNVYDGAGNMSSYSVAFTIDTEIPEQPTDVGPANFEDELSEDVTLKAKVTDPSGDKMDVAFYQGSKYDFARGEGIEGFSNIADREPPLMLEAPGENGLTEDDQTKLAFEDGEYLVNDSNMGFPYHRFEVAIDQELTDGDTVELYWKGKTFPNRKVTLYAWDHSEGKWIALQSATGDAAESDIVLTAEVDKDKFIKDGKVQAMVQDEVKNANDPFTILWATDTQYYAESYPYIWDGLGDWIVEDYNKGSFDYVIHSGDIVNVADSDEQWMVADRNLKKWDEAGIPYGVLAGNHDSIIDGIDYSYYHKWVGEDRYKNNPWYGGSMDNNRNHYDLMSFGGHDFIVVYLGFGLEDTPETIAWANEALQKHSDRNAILVMHAYLEYSATLSKMSQNVFDQIVTPNENVKMVMGGHYHGVATRVSELPNKDGSTRKVLEMLADYQGGPNGGDGYVRYLTFNPATETVDVVTYSPILDDYNFFDEEGVDTFTADYQLMDINKRVATDYFSVNVYTDKVIGVDEGVASGDIAKTEWTGLQPNETYYWYMNITDEYGATRTSDIFRFATANFEPSTDDPDDKDNPGDHNDDDKVDDNEPGNSDNKDNNNNNNKDNSKDNNNNNKNNDEENVDGMKGNDISDNNNNNNANNKTNNNVENSSNNNNSAILPNTATNIFNWLLIGLFVMLAGVGMNMARKAKRRNI